MKSSRGLGNSLGILASGTAANLVLGITQGVLTARLLGLEDFGRYASLMIFATIVAKVNDLGLPQAYSYFYRRSPGALPTLLRLLAINFCWCCLSAVLIIMTISQIPLPFAPVGGLSRWALAAFGILIAIGTPLNILISTVIATGNYKFLAGLNCATSLIQISLILLLATLGTISLQIFVGIAALASLIVAIAVTAIFVRRARHSMETARTPIEMREVISFGLRSQWGVLLKQLSSRFELLFVAGVLSPAQTGFFSLALSVRDAALTPQGIYAAPLQNLIIDRNQSDGQINDRSAILVSIFLQLILSTGMTVCAAIALPFVIPLLYGQEFSSAVLPSLILVTSTIFIGAAGICWIAFNAKGRPQLTSLALTVTGVPTPFVIYFMAEAYGLYGACFASLLMALICFLFSFGGVVWLQRYTIDDLRTGFARTPRFLLTMLGDLLLQLSPKRLFSKERR
jgi:O-antigen/teichoic acid export membrane protein